MRIRNSQFHLARAIAASSIDMPCHGASRLSPFEVGQIKAHSQHGLSTAEIAAEIIKADGTTAPSREAVRQVLLKLKANPGWTGERKAGSGRPRSTSKKLDTSLCKAVMAHRGKAKITSAILRKSVPGAGVMSTSTIRRRLAESGLEWLRRRRKTCYSRREERQASVGILGASMSQRQFEAVGVQRRHCVLPRSHRGGT